VEDWYCVISIIGRIRINLGRKLLQVKYNISIINYNWVQWIDVEYRQNFVTVIKCLLSFAGLKYGCGPPHRLSIKVTLGKYLPAIRIIYNDISNI
jgi:hypothetical protein